MRRVVDLSSGARVIRPAHALGAEATWADYVTWYGIHVGEFSEETIVADAVELDLEVRVLALGELTRRAWLEEKSPGTLVRALLYWDACEALMLRRRAQANRCPGWLDTSGPVQP